MSRPLTLEDQWALMEALGPLSIRLIAPFRWGVVHGGVFILSGEDLLVPETTAVNPYALVEAHWRTLTEGSPVIISVQGDTERHLFWGGSHWTEVRLTPTTLAA